MKYFELVVAFPFPLSKKFKDIKVILAGDDKLTNIKFQKRCKQIATVLKVEYQADNPDLPASQRKTREKIVGEIARELVDKFGMQVIEIEGGYTVFY